MFAGNLRRVDLSQGRCYSVTARYDFFLTHNINNVDASVNRTKLGPDRIQVNSKHANLVFFAELVL